MAMSTTPEFDEARVLGYLEELPKERRIMFGLSCAERLLPNYHCFRRESGWGKVDVLEQGLKVAWAAARGEETTPALLIQLIAECDEAAPEAEDFGTELCSAALDAANAVAALLRGILTMETDHFAEVASYAYDTVEMYTRDTEKLWLVAQELERQHAAMKLLCGESVSVTELEAQWRHLKVSNIGLKAATSVEASE